VGNIDYSYALDYDPNPLSGILSEKHAIAEVSYKKSSAGDSENENGIKSFDEGMILFSQKKNDEAYKLFQSVLSQYPGRLSGRLSLIAIDQLLKNEKRQAERESLLENLKTKNIDKNLTSLASHLSAKNMIETQNEKQAVLELQDIINSNSEFENMPFVLYDLGTVYYFNLDDKENGKKYLQELIDRYPDKDITKSALAILGNSYAGKKYQETTTKNNTTGSTKLIGNYPNPFNPSTIIKYNLAENTNVTLKVYDVLGREVKTLVNEFKPTGSYEVKFDASGLSSGLYFYQFRAGNVNQIQKMILTK